MPSPLFFEKLDIKFDISKLQAEFVENTKDLPILKISKNTFGWSITSSNGDYRDGFLSPKSPDFDTVAKTDEEIYLELEQAGVKPVDEYRVPTQLFKGEIVSIFEQLKNRGIHLFRIRYRLMPPGGKLEFHRDYPEWKYGVRLHVPVVTNEGCVFEYDQPGESLHMPAGTAYLVKVNHMHRALNRGTTDRVHIIADAFDVAGSTEYNKFPKEAFEKYLAKKKAKQSS